MILVQINEYGIHMMDCFEEGIDMARGCTTYLIWPKKDPHRLTLYFSGLNYSGGHK